MFFGATFIAGAALFAMTCLGDGQDFVGGVLCGVAVGAAIGTGGWGIGLALVGCGIAFGDW